MPALNRAIEVVHEHDASLRSQNLIDCGFWLAEFQKGIA